MFCSPGIGQLFSRRRPFNFVHLIIGITTAFYSSLTEACFPLYGGGACGGGSSFGSGCPSPPVYTAPMPQPAYPEYPMAPAYPSESYNSYTYPSQPYHASKSRTMSSDSNDHLANLVEGHNTCIRRFDDTRLICALAFQRRTPSDERECQRNCLDAQPRCHSFQYDPMGSICDLFEHSLASEAAYGATTLVPNPFDSMDDGGKWPRKGKMKEKQRRQQQQKRDKRFVLQNGVPLDGHSQTIMMEGRGGGGHPKALSSSSSSSSSSSCAPTLEPHQGIVFIGFDPGCDASSIQFLLDDEEVAAISPLPPPPLPSSSSQPTFGQLEPMPAPKLNTGNRRTEELLETTTTRRGGFTQPFVDPICAGSRDGGTTPIRPRMQLIDGIALVGGHRPVVISIQLDSADVCLHVCRQNAHLDARPFPAPCHSATFHRLSGKCEILGDAISPNGQLQYVPNPDSLYFEKICIPHGDLPMGCDDVIHRIPQHHLDPRPVPSAGTVQTAATQLECIRKCISARTLLGFPCTSASFFFDWPAQNCFLSRFTRLSRPDMYAAERKELVDYLEMPPCFQLAGIRQHDVPPTTASPSSSSVWSSCIGGIRWRRKEGNCTGEDAGECIETEECKMPNKPNGEVLQKRVAPSIEVAKQFRAPAVASEEASLFGEQDYENQKEISFFGPPQGKKEEEAEEMEVEGQNQNKLSIDDADDSERTSSSSPSPSTITSSAVCNPVMECCPLDEMATNGPHPNGIVRGCSLGKRTLADGRMVHCVPEKCQRRRK